MIKHLSWLIANRGSSMESFAASATYSVTVMR
jgi:hypothetical protein